MSDIETEYGKLRVWVNVARSCVVLNAFDLGRQSVFIGLNAEQIDNLIVALLTEKKNLTPMMESDE